MKLLLSAVMLLSLNAFAGIDLAKSEFKWTGKKVAGPHTGLVPLKSATLDVKKDAITGGEFVIDLTQLSATDLEGDWKAKLEGHLKSPDFFNVEKFPTATLKIKSVKGNAVTADLTVKGKTNPVKFDIKKDGMAYTGVLKFDRTKFDMVYNSGNYFKDLGDKLIDNEVTVEFKVVQN
ncbi:MAG: YceI family protein [Bacteriovoracaceae bacterium]|nr:YceI family protein [Bacteriovoracaceae bacterium]